MLHPPPLIIAQADVENGFGAVYEFFLRLTERETLAALAAAVVPTVLWILFIVVMAYIANRVVRRVIKRSIRRLATEGGMSRLGAIKARGPLADTTPMDIGRATMRAETVVAVLRSLATIAIWTVAVIMILGQFDINLGPLIAGAGIVGVALGFGAQRLVQDFLSGIFMLIEDQYGIGDFVDAGEAMGEIEAITLRTTRIRDIEGTVWHIPNGQITRIGNMSQQWARALLDIGVAYETDLPTAIDVIKRTADEVWEDHEWSRSVLDEPSVWGVQALSDSQITIRLVVKTVPGQQWMVSRELRKRLKAAFDAEGIEIPFPQRTVWVRSDNGGGPPIPFYPERQVTPDDRHRASPRDYASEGNFPDNDPGD